MLPSVRHTFIPAARGTGNSDSDSDSDDDQHHAYESMAQRRNGGDSHSKDNMAPAKAEGAYRMPGSGPEKRHWEQKKANTSRQLKTSRSVCFPRTLGTFLSCALSI